MRDLWRLLCLFKPYTAWLLLGVFLSFITLMANVSLLAVSGWFIAVMGLAGVSGATVNYFTPSALIRGAAIARTAGRYGERLVTHEATFRLLAELRVWFYNQLEPLAPSGLAQYHSGDLLSRIRADIDRLDHVYLRLLVPVAVAVLATVVFVVVLAFYHPLLALVELLMLLVAGVLVPWLVNRWGADAGKQMVVDSAELRTALVSDLQGMGELLVYGAAEQHEAHVQALSQQLAAQQQRMAGLSGIAQGALGLCANMSMWLMLLIAIPLVVQGALLPPDLAMLALFALASFEAVMPLPLAFQSLSETLAALRRIFELVDTMPVVSEPEQSHALPLPAHFDLEWRQVCFAYPNSEKPAVLDVTMQLSAGKKLAIIGATGSGKSTVASLLLRFRDVDTGAVYLAGQPLAAYSGEAVRSCIAVVPQQTHLFNLSIRNNLLLANDEATQEQLEHACRLACIHDMIIDQPEGYDTFTGETGVRLSGGQAKRVAIARALLKDAPVLLLDEPTEGLDPRTAAQVMDNIVAECERRGQSLLLITHRLQGLEIMDDIVVMQGGYIAEQGSHAELWKAEGVYHDFITQHQRLVW